MPDGPRSKSIVPRDDRAWPRGSFTASVVMLISAVAAGAALTWWAAADGALHAGLVAAAFVAAFAYGMSVSRPMMREWIAGRAMPGRYLLLQWAGLTVGVLVLVFLDAGIGWALLAGVIGGLILENARAIRAARANRPLVDEAEATTLTRTPRRQDDTPRGSSDPVNVDAVGTALRDVVAEESRRLVAWLIATAVGVPVVLALRASEAVLLVVIVMGVVSSAWVARRVWAASVALRDFTAADHAPRRAFVVLLNDPAPRVLRPLLGIWSAEPQVTGGRLPDPEEVYRCDEERDALQSFQGDAVVHEAWVDTGRHPNSRPRWVAADAGIALPHRRAFLGRWYLSRLIGGERPDRARPLTRRSPDPVSEGAAEPGRPAGTFLVALAVRAGILAAIGGIVHVLT